MPSAESTNKNDANISARRYSLGGGPVPTHHWFALRRRPRCGAVLTSALKSIAVLIGKDAYFWLHAFGRLAEVWIQLRWRERLVRVAGAVLPTLGCLGVRSVASLGVVIRCQPDAYPDSEHQVLVPERKLPAAGAG